MHIKILKIGEPNLNGRVYNEDCFNGITESYGQIGMSPMELMGKLSLESISHKITNIHIEDGWLVGDLSILETPKGILLKTLIENPACGFRPAGFGNIDDKGIVSNYTLTSIDFVLNPA